MQFFLGAMKKDDRERGLSYLVTLTTNFFLWVKVEILVHSLMERIGVGVANLPQRGGAWP